MKKGFTLIELLAVIVILAVIALIATPIVLNIINDTKESAVIRSADFYIDALENEIMLENMKQGGNFNPNTCTIVNKVVTCDSKEMNLKVDGEVPTSGSITFEEGKVKDVNLTYPNGTVTLNNKGELVLGEAQKELDSGLYDENNNLLASWDELVTKYDFKNKIETGGYNGDKQLGEASLVIIENYPKATKVVIDESVTSIGYDAFYGCTSLKELIIPDSVTSIGSSAFSECTSLTSITIPDSVTSIGSGAFSNCTSLTNITIPNGVEIIRSGTFYGCTSLTNIIIPDSVTSIEESAFMECGGLTSVIIGSGVKNIGNCAFANCASLTSVVIPNGVMSFEGGAFSGCTSLTSITIPSSVTSIEESAFSYCSNLITIYYKGTATGSPWGAPNATVKNN